MSHQQITTCAGKVIIIKAGGCAFDLAGEILGGTFIITEQIIISRTFEKIVYAEVDLAKKIAVQRTDCKRDQHAKAKQNVIAGGKPEDDQHDQKRDADHQCDQIGIGFSEKHFHQCMQDVAAIQRIDGQQVEDDQDDIHKSKGEKQINKRLHPKKEFGIIGIRQENNIEKNICGNAEKSQKHVHQRPRRGDEKIVNRLFRLVGKVGQPT